MERKAYLLRATIVAALGGLLFGFDTAVISGVEGWLQKIYGLSGFWLGFTVASALVGTVLGAISAGKPADLLGRRATLKLIAAFYLISAVGSALAWDWYSLVFFRFLGGLGVGGSSVVAPMYIAEIAPARLRGRLVAVTQLNIVFGILLAFFSNWVIGKLDLGEVEWRWMLGVEAFPAALFLALLFTAPRSPRWLIAKGFKQEASGVLQRTGIDTTSLEEQIKEIEASIDLARHTIGEPLFQRLYLKPILLAVAIAAFNQLSGINAILYYSKRIFEMAGVEKHAALFNSVVIGFTNLVFTILAMAVIDKAGRKLLMLAGSIGYIVSLSTVAAAFYTYGENFTSTGFKIVLGGLILFIASHAFGQGAVIWVFISEIFPNRVRAKGQALGSFTHWFMCAIISWTFPLIAERSGGHAFAFYALMMVLQLLWVIFVMPETKGVPLERMQKELGIE